MRGGNETCNIVEMRCSALFVPGMTLANPEMALTSVIFWLEKPIIGEPNKLEGKLERSVSARRRPLAELVAWPRVSWS
jgi:hypothetical protein